MGTAGINALIGAIPQGLRRGSDTRAVVITTVQDYDAASGRVLASVGGDPVWLHAITATYTTGGLIAVLRNPWTSRPELVLGPVPAGSIDVTPPPVSATPTRTASVRVDRGMRITTTRPVDEPATEEDS